MSGGGSKGGSLPSLPSLSDLLTLSPEQQALADFTLGQSNVRTSDIYARLGLGGSTMEAQDKAGNQEANLAQIGQLEQGNAGIGLSLAGLAQQGAIAQNAQNAQTSSALGGALGKLAGSLF
jgi:hypothetical protein